jgi:hypothetical protein
MAPTITSYMPPAVGEVVEVIRDGLSYTARIALKSCYIEVPMGMLDDAHLGDKIVLDADVTLRNVQALSGGSHLERMAKGLRREG